MHLKSGELTKGTKTVLEMSSTLYHNLEMGSNVYIGFLDTSKAFDTVWRRGLMVKLHNLGIKGQIWKVIDDCHCNTKSAVIVNQTKSRWFPVQQVFDKMVSCEPFYIWCSSRT